MTLISKMLFKKPSKRINYPGSTVAFLAPRRAPRYAHLGLFHRVNASCNCCGDSGQRDNTSWLRVSSLSTSVPIKWIWFLASYTPSLCGRRRFMCWSYLHKVMMASGNVSTSKQRCDWASLSLPHSRRAHLRERQPGRQCDSRFKGTTGGQVRRGGKKRRAY